jgi:cell wall-associated NlpC family hydrolase
MEGAMKQLRKMVTLLFVGLTTASMAGCAAAYDDDFLEDDFDEGESVAEDVGTTSAALTSVANFASSQLGKPYVFGATGLGSYDCSGLTWRAYSRAGISIPRGSRDQYAKLPKVSKSSLRPGDILAFDMKRDGRVDHVGIFIGSGMMVDASSGQKKVVRRSVFWDRYVGAVRPR